MLPKERTGANNYIHAVHTSLDRDLDIIHVTSYVCQNLGLEAQLADGFAVESALLTRARTCKLYAVYTELIELLGDLDLGLGVEVGIGELLALAKGRLDDLEV